jgi:hypothetical protein
MEALYALAQNLDEGPDMFLVRHASGDWGEVDEHDRRANEKALKDGLRAVSLHTKQRQRNLDRH